jgi:hypothetical protein
MDICGGHEIKPRAAVSNDRLKQVYTGMGNRPMGFRNRSRCFCFYSRTSSAVRQSIYAQRRINAHIFERRSKLGCNSAGSKVSR